MVTNSCGPTSEVNEKTNHAAVAPPKVGETTVSVTQHKAEILNNHFCSVFTTGDTTVEPDLLGSGYSDIDELQVSCDGVVKLLVNLQPFKASRPDAIPAWMLKELHCY